MRRSIAIAYLLAGAVLLASCSQMEERFKPLGIGDEVPAYATRTLAGDTARVGPGNMQPLTLLNVWATWCVPCQKEFPDLERIHRDYGSRGLRVLAVSVDADADDTKIRDFIGRYGATFSIGHDPEGTIRGRYQSLGIPESYLISPEGKLLFRNPGAFPEGAANVRAAIEAALPK